MARFQRPPIESTTVMSRLRAKWTSQTRHAVEMTAQITRIRSRAARIDIRAKLLQKVVLSEAGLDAGSLNRDSGRAAQDGSPLHL
jgi:hypothetical protein